MLNRDDWKLVKEALVAAGALDASEQRAHVEKALEGRPDLVREVMSLLEADRTPPDLLAEMEAVADSEEPLDPVDVGAHLGPYRLVERIGEGGMGDVWLAEQNQPLKRRVALKIVKLGMDTKQVVARFDQERQALALMDHPNIAKVFDGGAAPTGRPYFVMELVRGQDIDEYADSVKLDTRARIELFLQVCTAAQHAHQKGVLHRDLKPSNLLVRVQDGAPRVKVIDFGIAKALGADLTDQSVHTRMDQVIGTPDYMSPEQTDPAVRDVDTRADIYSLGVVLYELLTSTKPYHFPQSNPWAVMGVISETETVPPSAQFTRSETQETAARYRSTSVAALRRELEGDLDWIVMKAIEKDRTRRYQTVGELAADLGRYLASEPVTARPPSLGYRTRKFVRRNRAGVAAAAVASLAIVAGSVAASVGWARAEREARLATSRELAAAAIVQMQSDPELGVLLALRAAETAPTAQAEDALDRALDSRILRTIRYEGSIFHSAVSPDGHRVVTVSRSREVTIRALEDGTEILGIEGLAFGLPEFSPDGKWLIMGTENGEILILDATTGGTVRTIGGHEGRVNRARFDPTGHRIGSVGEDGTVRLWDAVTGAPLWVGTEPSDGESIALAFSPAGERMAVVAPGMEVVLLETATGRPVGRIEPPGGTMMDEPRRPASLRAVEFSPDGRRLLAAGTNGLHVWDTSTGEREALLVQPGIMVYDAAFSPDGAQIVAASADRVLHVFDSRYPVEAFRLQGHTNIPWSVAFTPEGDRVVSGSLDGTVHVWDTGPGAAEKVLGGHQREVWHIAYSRDGSIMTTASLDGTARIVRLKDGGPAITLAHGAPLSYVAVSPESQRVLTAGSDSTAVLWDASTGDRLLSLAGPSPRMMSADFDATGERIVTAGRPVIVWDATTGDELTRYEDAGSFSQALFAGEWVVATDGGPDVTIFDPATGAIADTLFHHSEGISKIAVSPDGRTLATAGHDGTAKLWDLETLRERAMLTGHTMRVYSVAFSMDGRRVVTGTMGGDAKIWDAETGAEILTVEGNLAAGLAAAFQPDGQRFALGKSDGRVYVYRHGLDALVEAVAPRATRDFTPAECVRFLHAKGCQQ